MISSRAEQGLHDLATDIRDALRKHESGEVQTTESKSSGITNIINNYPTGKSTRFGFFSTVGVIVTMILCGIALGIGWTLITNPEIILRWFGI
jgi:hypothetical protein